MTKEEMRQRALERERESGLSAIPPTLTPSDEAALTRAWEGTSSANIDTGQTTTPRNRNKKIPVKA